MLPEIKPPYEFPTLKEQDMNKLTKLEPKNIVILPKENVLDHF